MISLLSFWACKVLVAKAVNRGTEICFFFYFFFISSFVFGTCTEVLQVGNDVRDSR